jgi:hypothetical protein
MPFPLMLPVEKALGPPDPTETLARLYLSLASWLPPYLIIMQLMATKPKLPNVCVMLPKVPVENCPPVERIFLFVT